MLKERQLLRINLPARLHRTKIRHEST